MKNTSSVGRVVVASCVALAAVCASARSFEIALWRGETAACEMPDFWEVAPAPDGISVKLGSAKEIKYADRPFGRQYRSCLDKVEWDGGKGPRLWAEISVPADAKPGVYDMGMVRIRVVDHMLPPAKDWKYFLDLWQHPWAVSRYYGVTPFSSAHYARMEPVWKLLASAGQKTLTVTLVEQPWDHQCHDAYHPMIRRVKKADGTWRFDYDLFDEYVAFGRKCGLGPDIACYTMCPWEYHVSWEDEAGKLHRAPAKPGTPFFEEYWGPFLTDFKKHLEAKGWFEDAYVAMDERGPEDLKHIAAALSKYAPGMKKAMAGCVKPSEYKGLEFETYSSSLGCMTPEFLAEVPARRAKGSRTTFYVCCGPDRPNTFMRSELAESFWLGAYPAMCGLDGFLRWAWNSWPKDPDADASYHWWQPGDTFLVYPDGSPSTRFLELRNGIVCAEKIRILREAGMLDETAFKDIAAKYDRQEAMTNAVDFAAIRNATIGFVNK